MIQVAIESILSAIEAQKPFEYQAADGSFFLKVTDYVPYVCAAIHEGHQFREELHAYCTHSDYERWFEEDPATLAMVASQPIVIAGLDSRFEYDLNRAPDQAVYTDAWGNPLWHKPLPDAFKQRSLAKHRVFYTVVDALIGKLEALHGCCVVYDMHSYNWRRWEREVPTWNIGTANVDQARFDVHIRSWQSLLSQTPFPRQIDPRARINDTFQGNGYFLKHITQQFPNTLVLATEIKKIYCDERDGTIYKDVVQAVADYLSKVIKNHAAAFYTDQKDYLCP